MPFLVRRPTSNRFSAKRPFLVLGHVTAIVIRIRGTILPNIRIKRRAGSVHDGVRSAQIVRCSVSRPPEQVEDKAYAPMDLFAFGRVLYEMLTGDARSRQTGASVTSAILVSQPPNDSPLIAVCPRSPHRPLPAEGSGPSPQFAARRSAASRESICRRSGIARPAPRLSNSFSLCCEPLLSKKSSQS